MANNEIVGFSGSGTFIQSGGTNACGNLALAASAGGSGTYNLNGGLLIVSSLGEGSGSAAFNFNGGTLRAAGGFSTDLPMTLGGAATVDTAGYDVTFGRPLSGRGSLKKAGYGILVLSGSNDYTGGTVVSGGELEVLTSTALPDGRA